MMAAAQTYRYMNYNPFSMISEEVTDMGGERNTPLKLYFGGDPIQAKAIDDDDGGDDDDDGDGDDGDGSN